MKTLPKFEFSVDKELLKSNFKIFWITFFVVFVVVLLQYIGISIPKVINPFATLPILKEQITKGNLIPIFEKIKPSLYKKTNTFSLFQDTHFVQQTYALDEFINAKAYGVIDYQTGEILDEQNLAQQLPIASLTKLMTAIVALDIASPTDVFTASSTTPRIPTHIAITPGEQFSLEELLHASLMTSANDATQLIKEGIDNKYKAPVFIKAMNEKASFIGLSNTSFTNPQGFDNNHAYSTVHDLAILTKYALENYPLIAEIVKKDTVILPNNAFHKETKLYNWNGLLNVYPNLYGVKIGYTRKADHTTIVVSEREGKKVMVILLGAPSLLNRDLWASQLLDKGFQQLANLPTMGITQEQLLEKYKTWEQ